MIKSKVYHTEDCEQSLLAGKTVCIVGYGSQGRAFALNLRDSSVKVIVALREASRSIGKARGEGCKVVTLDEAKNSDIIVFAIPDVQQPGLYRQYLTGGDDKARQIVFLHGSNYHFKNIDFEPTDDVVLVAPHGPGNELREQYLNRRGLSCFFAVGLDVSGKAQETGLALASAVGCGKVGIYETTFADETIGDLFGEQTLLVGGLAGLTEAVFNKLVDRGISRENAYLETVKQLKLLATMIDKYGPAGMIERVSKTAAFGSLGAIPDLFDKSFATRLDEIYDSIETGQFNRDLLQHAEKGFEEMRRLLEEMKARDCQKTCDEFHDSNNNQ